ncbi:hypothetical protein [Streptomyces sp. NPDC096323]|uniref:hypothetical protein n=1 Tax=Streptomyces sp. NPDC096323 TaxID=3155822 RepID=UPI00331E983E
MNETAALLLRHAAPSTRALHEAGSGAVVIGQVAGIMHGSTGLAGDLDVPWDGSPTLTPPG